jgi:hypothetical protein
MNQKNPSQNSQNIPIMNSKPMEKGSIFDTMPVENKNSSLAQEHTNNSLFKVVQENKEAYPSNNILYLNTDKSNNKNNSKNINIIKPKFVTKTMPNDDNSIKLKLLEENPSLNLNLSSSAFQPQIIQKDKEFRVKVKDKIFNLSLDVKSENLKIKLYEINENIYSLKYFYENNFSMNDLKQLHNFFYLFDNVSDTMKELEKLLIKYKYNIFEDLENKKAKIHIKFILLEKEYNVEFPLFQKTYTRDSLFEILCKKVATISDEYGKKISFLEDKTNYLLMNFYRIMNTLNPLNMNYQMNQRGENNINKINNSFNNKININKNISVIKNSSNNENNKENNNNYEFEEFNEASNDISNTDNLDDEKELSENKMLNNKRKRKSSFNSNNKSNYIQPNKNKDTTNNITNITNFNNNESLNSDNYYFLRDIKSKKLIKCKGLFEIIHSPDELHMIVNKILYKLSKYKKSYMTSNYENKLQFSIHNLFDSSFDGDSAYDFHSKCDFKYNTISVIETTGGRRFGGYTSECFESPNEYFDKKDNLSFVFSFDKMRIYEVIKGKYAISCDKNYGPYFRDDHICIVDEFLSKESGTCIKGKGFNTTKNYELNSGKKYFTIKRLQVFQIKIKNLK